MGQTGWCVWQRHSPSSRHRCRHSKRNMRVLALHSGGKDHLYQRNSNLCNLWRRHRHQWLKYRCCKCHCHPHSLHSRHLQRHMQLRPSCRASRAWCKGGRRVLCRTCMWDRGLCSRECVRARGLRHWGKTWGRAPHQLAYRDRMHRDSTHRDRTHRDWPQGWCRRPHRAGWVTPP